MQNQNPNVETQYRTMTVLWAALLFSQVMLLVILFIVKPEIFKVDLSKSPLSENPAMIIVLAVLGILTFLLSFVLSKNFINQAISEQKTTLVQSALIIGCALCEATSLFGYVLAFALTYQYFFLWFALGILGMILHFPKRDNLIAASYKR